MSEKQITMPVDRLSYSSMTQLLRNPIIFKMKHILGIYDTRMGVSGMIGQACHKAFELYYGGNKDIPISANKVEAQAAARSLGMEYLVNFPDHAIEYGKTGSREDMLAGYTQAMDFYFAEEPEYHEILFCETKMSAEAKTLEGDVLPLPITGKPDLVHRRKDGGVEIVDTKLVTSFTDYETEDFVKIIQAQFMFHLLLASTGIQADRMLFREIKRTRNKDGSPQIRDWAIPFDHAPYRIIFYNLFKDVVKFLSNDPVFLPNISDMFDGEQAGLIYAQGLINADMSDVEVMHKVRDVAFTTKKFVASRLDSVENQNLAADEKIKMRLAEFGIPVEPVETIIGSTVTRYVFKVSAGIRMSSITKHKADIARAVESAGDIDILAPIPGTPHIGVDVPNEERTAHYLKDQYIRHNTLSLPIGLTVNGTCLHARLDEMPHLLIAGATGSGKSVLLHNLITSLTRQMKASEMELVLFDPKRVELRKFAKSEHLKGKIIYEYEDGVRRLMKLNDEMEKRYQLLEKEELRDIGEYNKKHKKKMPYIVTVIDEFADFMMSAKMEESKRGIAYSSKTRNWLMKELVKRAGKSGFVYMLDEEAEDNMRQAAVADYDKSTLIDILEGNDALNEMNRPDANVELLICRLARMARAVGIHLIIATQRPSVDVITGNIKSNFPTRIALTTSSPTDSVVILGQPGAEKLAGKGDMLLMSPFEKGLVRLQGFNI